MLGVLSWSDGGHQRSNWTLSITDVIGHSDQQSIQEAPCQSVRPNKETKHAKHPQILLWIGKEVPQNVILLTVLIL